MNILTSIEAFSHIATQNSILYDFMGSKMIFATSMHCGTEQEPVLAGINIYYFNDFDAEIGLNAVHEAFIGVLPSQRGKGIATALRQAAFKHFERSKFIGITTRIKKNNQSSLASALGLGFSVTPKVREHQHPGDELYLFRAFGATGKFIPRQS